MKKITVTVDGNNQQDFDNHVVLEISNELKLEIRFDQVDNCFSVRKVDLDKGSSIQVLPCVSNMIKVK